MVVPFWEYRLLGTFYQNNGSPVKTKTLLVSDNEMKIKDQDQQVTNPCPLISIKGQGQGSGFARKAAAIGSWKPKWIRTLDVRMEKWSRLLLFNPFCFGCHNGFFRPNSLRGQISRENGSLAHREYGNCCNYAIQVVAYAPGMQKLTLFVGAF